MATSITALPAVPNRNSSPDTFSDDADAFLGALPTFRTELNTVAAEAEANKNTAVSSASTATTQAGISTTGANTATTQAGIATTQAGIATTGANTATTKATEFKAAYLGSFAVDQTLDGNGNPVTAGALYFNTTIDLMRVYNGASWQDASSSVNGTANRYDYTATAGQTVFSATYDIGYVDVYFNGIRLVGGDDFTATNGSSITLTTPADAGDSVYIIGFGNFVFSKAVPNEIGNGGKFLTTDGAATPVLSWASVTKTTVGLPNVTNDAQLKIASNLSDVANIVTARDNIEAVGRTITLPTATNFNTVTTSGFYRLTDANTNAPTGIDFGQLIVSRGSDTALQIASGYQGGTIWFRQGSGIGGGSPVWTTWRLLGGNEAVNILGGNFTAISTWTYILTVAATTLTLPASPISGDWVKISNRSGSTTCVVGRNGQNIMGLAENMTINDLNAGITLIFTDATRGWILA